MSFRDYAVIGVKWSAISQFTRQGIQLLTTLILARILQPSDFGLMGMVLVVVGFLNIFKDVGTSAAVIQKKEISQQLLSSIFWLNVFFGLIISVIMYIGSPIFALIFNEKRLITIFQFFIIAFFSGTLISLQQALLEKQMNFRKLAFFEITSVVAGSIVGIYTAYHGSGVWSLVFQTTVASLVLCSLFWIQSQRWVPLFHFTWGDIRDVVTFSSNLTGFTIFNYFLRNADSVIIGRYLGANDLGFYNLAYKVMIVPLQNLTSVISRVMFPLYSAINDENDKVRKAFSKVAMTIAFFTFPFFACLMITSNEFVLVVFGDRWYPVAQLLLILSPVGFLQSIDVTTGSLYLAKGRTDLMFRWGLFSGILFVSAFYLGSQWGLKGVATSYLVVTLLWTYPGFAIPLNLIEQNTLTFFKQFRPLILLGVIVSGVVFAVNGYFPYNLLPIEKLSMSICIMVSGYIGLSFVFNRYQINELKKLFNFKIQ